MTDAQYWKLKAAVMQHQNAQIKLEMLAAQAKQTLDAAMQAAGLDPAKHYTMNDDTLTVEEATRPDATT